ncbi:MAG: rhomboid family intramembrane serine protease [Ignavibacteriaceae bacterium]|nr:rhomboid family intramembrane serine protease [Ignavibacteriaceae bacterium]
MSDYYRPSGFGGFSLFPPVIKNLIIINVIVFFIQFLGGQVLIVNVPASHLIDKWFALNPLTEDGNFQVWQLITYQFMHGGFTHILFNMLALWMFGMEVENLWGSKKFLTFYLLCGIVAGISQLVFPALFNEPQGYTIGASGAIMGVLVAFGMLFPDRYIYIYFLLPVKAKYFVIIYIVIEFFSIPSGGDVAHLAHLGGALAGFIFVLFNKKPSYLRNSYYNSDISGSNKFFDSLKNPSSVFKKKDDEAEDAKYYEINGDKNEPEISQEEIDKILDKISQSGYQNLSDREKKVLFEASKRMK